MFEILSEDEILGIISDVDRYESVTQGVAKAQRDKDIRDVVEDLREKAKEQYAKHIAVRIGSYYAHRADILNWVADEYEAKLGRLDNDKMGNSEAEQVRQ